MNWNNAYLQKLRSISIGTTGIEARVTDTNFFDKQIVEKGLKSSDPNERDQARKAGERIRKNNQNGKVRGLRKELVKLHKEGKTNEIKEIHEVIKKA